eukprot:Skav214200  [mRNA]  locus=scaffold2153:196926:199919:+ [translate_table: standard]
MHPRNKHRDYLDYRDLAKQLGDAVINWQIMPAKCNQTQKALRPFVYENQWGGASIDYSDPKALEELSASCIYSLLGAREYGWRFIATDIDQLALQHARQLVAENDLQKQIKLRRLERW